MTIRAVCANCNNGWMAELEDHARALLHPMLHGRGRALHRSGQRTLAAWALKTAMMVDHTLAPEQRGFPTEEYVHLYEHREPSGRVRIWMSSYVGDMPASGRLYGVDVDVGPGGGARSHAGVFQPAERGWRDIYGATISFGPVVFQAFATTVEALLDGWLILNPHPIVFPLWPYRESFTWTPATGFDDHGLTRFADAILGHVQQKAGRSAAS